MNSSGHDPITIALAEDIGDGDLTTDTFVPEQLRASGRVITREKTIVAGSETAAEVFRRVKFSRAAVVKSVRSDGSFMGLRK